MLFPRCQHTVQLKEGSNITSRPSQNSFSVICPPITSSRCKAASSGVLRRTFFRSLKSLVGSLNGVPDARESLPIEGAREVEGFVAGMGDLGAEAFADIGATEILGGLAAGVVAPLRLRLMMLVNSTLNFSRSLSATGWGAVKVKLCPASSPTSPIFSLT